MAFSKKTWKNRISQYINRRLLTDSDGNTQQVTVTRDEGSVTEAGDAFSASNMNDLEDRIEDAFDGLTAADIPYSSGVSVADKLDNVPSFDTLTTSDNNKLLGVSVSGSDISVGAVALSAIKSNMILGNFAVYSAERILNNATKSIPLTQNLFVLFFKSYAQAGCYGAYLISYHPSVQSSQYISTLAKGNSNMPTLSISGSNLVIATGGTDIYYSMLRLN